MAAPVFGDLVAINRYTVNPNKVYEILELVERDGFPADLRGRYYEKTSDICMVESPSDPRVPAMWEAIAKVEAEVRAWGTANGYRVAATGMRDDEGQL